MLTISYGRQSKSSTLLNTVTKRIFVLLPVRENRIKMIVLNYYRQLLLLVKEIIVWSLFVYIVT